MTVPTWPWVFTLDVKRQHNNNNVQSIPQWTSNICTTTTQRVPNVHVVLNTLGSRCTNVAAFWNTLDSHFTNVAGSLGLLRRKNEKDRDASPDSKLIQPWMDGAILRPFQQYFSHIRTMGGWWWKAMCNGNPVYGWEKFSPRAELEPRTASSVGQRLTYWATGAPHSPLDGWWQETCAVIKRGKLLSQVSYAFLQSDQNAQFVFIIYGISRNLYIMA